MKQPYEMTKAEYMANGIEYVRGDLVSYYPIPGAIERKPRFATGHVFHINQALTRGQVIPAEVQRDYPTLFN